MKNQSIFLLALLLMAALYFPVSAQKSDDGDCAQFQAVLNDAEDYFTKYEGDLYDDDGVEAMYDYNFVLWDDEGSGLYYYYYDYDLTYVEFYYHSSADLEEAKAFYNDLLQRIRNCLPSNYYECASSSTLPIYNQFANESDRGNILSPKHALVEISLDDKKDYYLVMITFEAPEE